MKLNAKQTAREAGDVAVAFAAAGFIWGAVWLVWKVLTILEETSRS